MIKERFTAPPFAFKAMEGKQGLRFHPPPFGLRRAGRVKQKIEIQKPHFSK
jgi:hypothetical protein